MQLRSTTRLPGRYREDDVPDLPGTAAFVHPNVPYNANLPPAVFPTLDYPRPVDTRPAEVMVISSRPESPESDPEQDVPEKRATVFHGKQQSSKKWLMRRSSSNVESEEVGVLELATSKLQEWDVADENVAEPGEYDGWGVMANDDRSDESQRIGLSVYEPAETWSRVTDGLKLIIVLELTAVYSFREAMKKLMLTAEEHNEVIDLFEREIARQAEEEDKIARSQARQLEMLMSGSPAISREAISASFEDLYANIEDSPMFIIKKSDIALAQRFLRSVNIRECADRLWRYEGVAQPPIVWNMLYPKPNEPSNEMESTLVVDEQESLQALKNAENGLENGKKRKSEAMIQKMDQLLSNAKPIKRRRLEGRPISSKQPSGLRNSISGANLEETMALGPPALQGAFSPQKKPALPPRQRPVKEKKPVTPRVRFIQKCPAQPSALQTPPKKTYKPLEHTPDSPTARKQTQNWLADQIEPYTQLPPLPEKTSSPLSIRSRGQDVRLTSSQARSAQIDNILGKKTDIVAKVVRPDKGNAVLIAPPMGPAPQISPEKTSSASKHVDAELTPGIGNVDNDARKAMEPMHMPGGKVNELLVPASHAQSESIAKAPRQKKPSLQGQDDSAYRASGQRRPKIREHDVGVYKASGQTRQKIQDAEKVNQHLSPGKEIKRKDVAEPALSGAAASQLTATNVSVSEASAAKFKGVKLLEQVPNISPAKTNHSNVAAKDNAGKIEDGKQVIGQKHKRVHDPDEDPDL